MERTTWAPGHEACIAHLRQAAGDVADAVASTDLDAPVASCPGWTVRDVAVHLGGIHRWARTAVLQARADDDTHAAPPDPELGRWLRAGAAELAAALETTPLDAPVWAFGPKPRRVVFWSRRIALETSVHLWDVLAGQGWTVDADLAADGVDEVATMFYPRQVRLGRIPSLTRSLALLAPDAGPHGSGGAVVVIGPEGAEPEATVTGPASALLLLVWRRTDLSDPMLRLTGDEASALQVLDGGLTP